MHGIFFIIDHIKILNLPIYFDKQGGFYGYTLGMVLEGQKEAYF
jgi:hypothetical protein